MEPFSKEDILEFLVEEKDAYNTYVKLCARYEIMISPIAERTSQAIQMTLQKILDGKPKQQILQDNMKKRQSK